MSSSKKRSHSNDKIEEHDLKKNKPDNEEELPPPPPPPVDSSNDNNNNSNSYEEDDEEDAAAFIIKSKKNSKIARKDCPYLDTVNRNVLDFDFEKSCSVSFVNLNVYACLVCGKKFQGKSTGSHAHYHCMQSNHHVFINLHNQKIYCLPDDYEVLDPSLDDIKYLINPTFTKQQIALLDSNTKHSRSLDGTSYLPGFIGLNNIKKNSFFNVTIQSLTRVGMVRDYFINQDNIKNCKSNLVNNFGELIRKIWNPRNFKGHVSPHELIQAVQNASNNRFTLNQESDPFEFIQWILNSLSTDLNSFNSEQAAKNNSSNSKNNIIQRSFGGEVRLTVTPAPKQSEPDKPIPPKVNKINFLTLVLDLPGKRVFQDKNDQSLIPQIPLFTLLLKYDGVTPSIQPNGETRHYKLLKLPRYLILCIKRFSYNNFFKEKDLTIVNFPLKNLDLKDYLSEDVLANCKSTKYNLLSNIKHEGEPNSGSYTAYVYNKGFDKWFEIQDLSVTETLPQLVAVSEAYILIYEMQH